ncbi:MAG: NAD(P)H-hydrate epimerase, partial [Aridibacter sp.]
MQKVLMSEQMREVDRLTTEKYGIPSILLMENAAHATARIITEKLGGSVEGKSFLILCGKGNNGGDGAALARILWQQNAWVTVNLLGKVNDTKGDAKTNFEINKNLDIDNQKFLPAILFQEYEDIQDWQKQNLSQYTLIIDSIFGTGLSREVKGKLKEIIGRINSVQKNHETKIFSIDLPSGLNADEANPIGKNISADLTVTFTAPKIANVLPPASNFNGELHIANIGSPQELIDNCASQTFLAEKEDAQNWLERTKFSSDSYKNKRGNALLIVGSKNYTGAAVLVGNAAMVSGIGLVTIATSESAQESVSARVLPEVITQNLAETKNGAISEKAFEKIKKLSEKADVLAIGSGLSSDEETTRK